MVKVPMKPATKGTPVREVRALEMTWAVVNICSVRNKSDLAEKVFSFE